MSRQVSSCVASIILLYAKLEIVAPKSVLGRLPYVDDGDDAALAS